MEVDDETYDCVVCSHILEHVIDQRALTEIRGVLRPGGMAVMMVPLVEGWSRTYKNASITTTVGRKLHFGQSNHVRFYGADVRDRIRKARFELNEFTAEEPDESFLRTSARRQAFCREETELNQLEVLGQSKKSVGSTAHIWSPRSTE